MDISIISKFFNSKKRWNITFLSVTLLAIVMEIYASFDNSANTSSWTMLVTGNVSSYITFGALGLLAVWVFPHFAKWYKAKKLKIGYFKK